MIKARQEEEEKRKGEEEHKEHSKDCSGHNREEKEEREEREVTEYRVGTGGWKGVIEKEDGDDDDKIVGDQICGDDGDSEDMIRSGRGKRRKRKRRIIRQYRLRGRAKLLDQMFPQNPTGMTFLL